jgi:hypothetical protein
MSRYEAVAGAAVRVGPAPVRGYAKALDRPIIDPQEIVTKETKWPQS